MVTLRVKRLRPSEGERPMDVQRNIVPLPLHGCALSDSALPDGRVAARMEASDNEDRLVRRAEAHRETVSIWLYAHQPACAEIAKGSPRFAQPDSLSPRGTPTPGPFSPSRTSPGPQ